MKQKIWNILLMLVVLGLYVCEAEATVFYFTTDGEINDGDVYDGGTIWNDATVDMYGGIVNGDIGVNDQSTFNLRGGLATEIYAHDSSTVNIFGGIANDVYAEFDSTLRIYGGDVGRFGAGMNATIHVYGGDLGRCAAGQSSLVYIYGYDIIHTNTGGYWGDGQLEGKYYSDNSSFKFDLWQDTFSHIQIVPESATTYYVDAVEGSDDNDGLSPETAFATIQKAIDSAFDGDTVIVADGTYTGPGNRDIDFLGKAITVRSESGPNNCIIDCEASGRGFNFDDGEDANSVLDGFTITNGEEYQGGGIYCNGSSPTITNCIISGNSTGSHHGGGGIYCRDSNPFITNCTISGNYARGPGGGIACRDGSPTITNCTISGNSAEIGGAIFCWSYRSLIINNSIIWGNAPPEIYTGGLSINVTYTDIQGGWEGEGNIDADPLLTLDGHLQAGSPCIDVGDPNADFTSQVDIDGEPRIKGTYVDMGADEFLDSDTDGLPDWWESKYFGSTNVAEPNADTDLDGYTNLTEYLYSSDPTVGATAYYVDANQPDDSGDGLSWETAKSTIQAAINATKNCGDQVIITPGIYTGLGNYGLDPGGKAIIIQSTAPNAPEVVASTIIDPNREGRGFYFHSSETTRCVVSGLTITNGQGPGEDIEDRWISRGGAILCSASSPTIINCTIIGNSGDDYGGGICCTGNSNPTIDNCTVTSNSADRGAGIYCDANSNPTISKCTITGNKAPGYYCCITLGGGSYCRDSNPFITNCTISGNDAATGDGIYCGASSPTITNCTISGHVIGRNSDGIYCEDNSSPTITNCFISENHRGIYCEHSSPMITGCTITSNWAEWGPGGGIFSQDSNLTITSSTISDNTAEWGAGISCYYGSTTITNCTITGNSAKWGGGICCYYGSTTINNCTITGNSAEGELAYGGGILCAGDEDGNDTFTFSNCTITGNSATWGGGICCGYSSTTIANCILWANEAPNGPELYLAEDSNALVNYTDVQGGPNDVYIGPDCTLSWGLGNIDVDPCFVEPGYWDANDTPDDVNDDFWIEGDYYLLPNSLCIDAGDPNYIPEPNETDIDGNPRIINGRIDMGAYESNYTQAAMKLTPQMLNCNSKGKYVKAHLTLPEGFLPQDVDVNESAIAEPMGVYSEYIKVLGSHKSQVRLEIAFDHEAFCDRVSDADDDFLDVTVIGSLTTSQYFYATDTIKIKPRR